MSHRCSRPVECVSTAGAPGITVHPRADARHITRADVRETAAFLNDVAGPRRAQHRGRPAARSAGARPRSESHSVHARPCPSRRDRPARPGGRPTAARSLLACRARLRAAGIRVSLFVDPERRRSGGPARLGADRVELYTEPFARAFERGAATRMPSFASLRPGGGVSRTTLGLGVNAGHDLDLDNLVHVSAAPPSGRKSRSVTRSSVTRCSWGWPQSVREYLAVLADQSAGFGRCAELGPELRRPRMPRSDGRTGLRWLRRSSRRTARAMTPVAGRRRSGRAGAVSVGRRHCRQSEKRSDRGGSKNEGHQSPASLRFSIAPPTASAARIARPSYVSWQDRLGRSGTDVGNQHHRVAGASLGATSPTWQSRRVARRLGFSPSLLSQDASTL